jgi:antitoxin MazE
MAKTARLTIQQWGNSLAVRIPAQVARSAHFQVGQEVEVTAQESGVTVTPIGPRKLTLAQKLELFRVLDAFGNHRQAKGVGAEVI